MTSSWHNTHRLVTYLDAFVELTVNATPKSINLTWSDGVIIILSGFRSLKRDIHVHVHGTCATSATDTWWITTEQIQYITYHEWTTRTTTCTCRTQIKVLPLRCCTNRWTLQSTERTYTTCTCKRHQYTTYDILSFDVCVYECVESYACSCVSHRIAFFCHSSTHAFMYCLALSCYVTYIFASCIYINANNISAAHFLTRDISNFVPFCTWRSNLIANVSPSTNSITRKTCAAVWNVSSNYIEK